MTKNTYDDYPGRIIAASFDRGNIMIDPTKVKLMTRISIYEQGEGKKDMRMNRSKQSTYVHLKMLETLFCVTIAYVLGVCLYSMRYFSSILTDGFKPYKSMAINMVILYVGLMIFSQIFTYFYYKEKYRLAHRRIVRYDKNLSRLDAYLQDGEADSKEYEIEEEDV